MRVLHVVAGNRWTGAAAPAFAEVEALRAEGVDAHFAYVGDYRLEKKIGHHDFAHAIIEKAQNPLSFLRGTAALDRMLASHGFDIIHAHLTHDHWLARMAARDHDVRIARTFHARRVLRTDILTRSLIRRTDLLFNINETFADAPAFAGRQVHFTPPPLDLRQFSPEGSDARSLHGIPADEKIVTVIGKLSPGRGFEDALRTFASLRRVTPCRLMIIGRGPHRPLLEGLAASLGITPAVIWAGYHEDQPLAEHYRASNLLLFTARGSDEGHRAVLEAMACGVPPAVFPLEGVEALVPRELIAAESKPEALAAVAASMLEGDLSAMRQIVIERSKAFDYRHAAERLIRAYEMALR